MAPLKKHLVSLATALLQLTSDGEYGTQSWTGEARLVPASNSSSNLPILKLPYGSWQATSYNQQDDIYSFKNIRFAAPATGQLRWAKPAEPVPNNTLQTGSVGGSCYNWLAPSMLYTATAGGLSPPARSDGSFLSEITTRIQTYAVPLAGQLLATFPSLLNLIAEAVKSRDVNELQGSASSSEDCLFLDLYVPGKALSGNKKLPVINWIYGGAFIVGNKDSIYDGGPIVQKSNGNAIVVVGNYRVGPLGFLNGDTVEKQGTPNAGFWDQRAVLEWIHKYIDLVNGDTNEISLWGESAGAGSVMHHLASFGGSKPSLFKRAVVESPANRPQYDRRGGVEDVYKQFEKLAGCAGQGLNCLRKAPIDTLREAGSTIIKSAPPGEFGFGPSVDGDFSRQLPDLEFASGNFLKDVESIIVTHTAHEGEAFVEDQLRNNKTFFETGIRNLWGNQPAILRRILERYPNPTSGGKYRNEQDRMVDYMSTQFFACHTRTIARAYAGKVWVGQYSRGDGRHGRDIDATFYNATLRPPLSDPKYAEFAETYQHYLLAHAINGDPSSQATFADGRTPWPKVEYGATMRKVLDMGDSGFKLIGDPVATAESCDFWVDIMSAVTRSAGYTPANGQVPSKFV